MVRKVRYKSFDQISFTDMLVYSKLPRHSFWSSIEEKIDFDFADPLCSFLYTGRGQHPYAPSLKLKIHLVQVYYNLSDRQTEEKIIGDLFVKRFLGLPVEFFGFDHSTIALDRERLGPALFRACHLYILAQLYRLGLWGERNESWIIDSFPCNTGIAMVGAYRLIQQAMIRVLQHVKRGNAPLYRLAQEVLLLDAATKRLPPTSKAAEQLLAFSKLVAQAHALLDWFGVADVAKRFERWDKKKESLKLQSILRRVLSENSKPVDPDDPTFIPLEPGTDDIEQTSSSLETVKFEKIPRSERPTDRIISANDPDARSAKKTASQTIKGYKTQNLCTTGGVILDVKVIPACEHDREATFEMVQGIQAFFGTSPQALLGDTSYGHSRQRIQLDSIGVAIVAPVPPSINPTGLYDNSMFIYNPDRDVYLCPNDKESQRKSRSKRLGGVQYHFGKACQDCPLRLECTTNESGRSVFRHDHHDIYRNAEAVNQSEEGKLLLRQRLVVERKNQELKNDCGLGRPNTRSQLGLSVKAILAAIVVNLKLAVRRLCAPKPGFVRRARSA